MAEAVEVASEMDGAAKVIATKPTTETRAAEPVFASLMAL